MTQKETRLDKLEMCWRQPPSWRVWVCEETTPGLLVDLRTAEPVQPGPGDVLIVVSTCPPGRVRPPGGVHERS